MTNAPIVCPFCPLACDDVRVDSSDGSVDVECDIAGSEFNAAVAPSVPRIGTTPSDNARWDELRARFSVPEIPVVEINGASVQESKVLETLVAAGRIQIRPVQNDTRDAIKLAIAREGMMAATLGDVCKHADLIWICGNIDSATPRLRDRFKRTGAHIEDTPTLSIDLLSRLVGLDAIAAADRQTSDVDADRIIAQMENSRYTAVVLGESAFASGSEVIISEMLLRWMASRNERNIRFGDAEPAISTRMVMIRFEPNQSLEGVMRWRNNNAPWLGLSKPQPATIRIGSSTPDATKVQLQIGGRDPGPELAEYYLPAATPGVHESATTIRGDGSVTLPLVGWSTSGHRSRIETLCNVLDR